MAEDLQQAMRAPSDGEGVADSLARELQRQMLKGEVAPGVKLPSQRTLSERYGVSRQAVREAVAELQARGLVETFHGGGSFCRNLFEDYFQFSMPDQQQSSFDFQCQVMEMREVLEGEAAYFAALRATPVQRERLTAEYRRMQDRATGETTLKKAKADLTFHMMIAESSHHYIVMSISQLLYTRYFNAIYGVLSRTLQKAGRYPPRIPIQHAEIYQAIMARDAEQARMVAQEHIRYTRDQLQTGGA